PPAASPRGRAAAARTPAGRRGGGPQAAGRRHPGRRPGQREPRGPADALSPARCWKPGRATGPPPPTPEGGHRTTPGRTSTGRNALTPEGRKREMQFHNPFPLGPTAGSAELLDAPETPFGA